MRSLRVLVAIAIVPACSVAYLKAGDGSDDDDDAVGSDAGFDGASADGADEPSRADAGIDGGEVVTCDGNPCVPQLAVAGAGAWSLFVANTLTWVRCTGAHSVALGQAQKDGGARFEDAELANVNAVAGFGDRVYAATNTNILVTAGGSSSTYATVGAKSLVATSAGVFLRGQDDKVYGCGNALACGCDGGTCGQPLVGMSESQFSSGVDFQLMTVAPTKVSVIRLKALVSPDFHTLATGETGTGVGSTLVAGSLAFWGKSSRLYRATIADPQGPPDLLADVAGAGDITGIVARGAFVYFTTVGTLEKQHRDGALYRVRATGGAPTKVAADLEGPHSLVLDEIAAPPMLYWASFDESSVTAPAGAYCDPGKGSIFALPVPD